MVALSYFNSTLKYSSVYPQHTQRNSVSPSRGLDQWICFRSVQLNLTCQTVFLASWSSLLKLNVMYDDQNQDLKPVVCTKLLHDQPLTSLPQCLSIQKYLNRQEQETHQLLCHITQIFFIECCTYSQSIPMKSVCRLNWTPNCFSGCQEDIFAGLGIQLRRPHWHFHFASEFNDTHWHGKFLDASRNKQQRSECCLFGESTKD